MIRQLGSQSLQFRILALSATPGGDAKVTLIHFLHVSARFKYSDLEITSPPPHLTLSLQSVQSVISNLLISHIELRSEESPDIQAHSHQRNVEKVVVPLGDVLSAYQARYLEVGTCK